MVQKHRSIRSDCDIYVYVCIYIYIYVYIYICVCVCVRSRALVFVQIINNKHLGLVYWLAACVDSLLTVCSCQ
jgi:hypothetical protein